MTFFYWATCDNRWLWFHMMAGGLAGIGLRRLGVRAGLGLALCLAVAVAWEGYERLTEAPLLEVYGSVARWFADSLGDVLGAVMVAAAVYLGGRK